jgi:ribosomal protein S18 acetylase RimI-like enzyme
MPNLRPYRAIDWDSFLALDLETGLASIPAAADKLQFAARWPTFLKTTYGWGADGPSIGRHTVWLLDADNGSYAGHLWFTEQPDFFTGRTKGFITTIAVVAAHRGLGFGELLMKHAINEARSRGYAQVVLGVDAANVGAIGLYEKLEFHTTRLSMEKSISSQPHDEVAFTRAET